MKGVLGNLPISQLGQQIINGKKKKKESVTMRFISLGQGGSKSLACQPIVLPSLPQIILSFIPLSLYTYVTSATTTTIKMPLPPSLMGPTPNQPPTVTLLLNPTAHLPSLINTHSFLSHLNPHPSKILNPTHYLFLFFFNKHGV